MRVGNARRLGSWARVGAVLLLGCAAGTDPGGSPGNGSVATGGPAAGRRLTKDEYINTLSDLLNVDLRGPEDRSVLPDDEPATGGGFRDDIAGLLPSAVRTDAYEVMATRVAERVPWAGGLAAFAVCTDPTRACREDFIRRLGHVLYRRPLQDADSSNLLPLFDAEGTAAGAAEFEGGARLVLQAMLQSPHFLYRLERLDNPSAPLDLAASPDANPSAPPSPSELATRLAYLVWRSTPTADLLDSAERGDLASDASFQASVERMLSDPKARRGFEAYADDWLQLYRLDARTATPDLGVTADLLTEMKQETRRFLDRIALDEARDLTALFLDPHTELGPALAAVYGQSPAAPGFVNYDLSNDPARIGLLTQPGFLILRAAPARVTIVHRGLMVLRVFLCTEVPPPPDGVAAQINDIPIELTDRDRFALHTASPACSGCHAAFDPLGYPFEPFDLAGRWRAADDYGNPLRSDGELTLDGTTQTFANTAEFAALLARSPAVRRCFAQKLFQYGLGRALQASDAAALDQIAQNFETGGRTYFAALRSVASSPALRALGQTE